MSREKRFEQFLILLPKLEPIEFFGLCQILKVQLVNDKKEERAVENIIEDLLVRFPMLGTSQQKQILKVMKEAQKKN